VEFEWDPEKAEANHHKHGLTFVEACTAFVDPLSLTIPDPDHSLGEVRFVLLGYTDAGRLVAVVHVERGENLRLISARLATKHERRAYEDERIRR
jgi:uncharacterized protein